MALKNWNAAELRVLADSLDETARRIRGTAKLMEATGLSHIVLQASVAVNNYVPTLSNLAIHMESEFSDQFLAAKEGHPARWEINQSKVEARNERNKIEAKRSGASRSKIGSVVARRVKRKAAKARKPID